jgi:hypothetical protein
MTVSALEVEGAKGTMTVAAERINNFSAMIGEARMGMVQCA